MNEQEVLIKILTAFEAGGIEAAKKAANELKKEVESNSSAGKTLAGALDLLNSKGQNAGQVFNGLTGILKGGQGAAAGMSKVVQGLGGALGMAAGPLAILTTGIGLAISAWQSYKEKQEEAAAAAKKAAEEAAAAAQQHLEELNKIRLEAVSDAVKGLKDGLDGISAAARTTRERLDSLEDSQLDVDLAKIDAQLAKGEITSEDAQFQKARARSEAAERHDSRELADLDKEWDRISQAADDTKSAAEAAAQKEQEAQAALAAAEQALAQAKKPRARMGYIAAGEQQKKIDAAQAAVAQAKTNAENATTSRQAADAAAKAAEDELFGRGTEVSNQREILRNKAQARLYRNEADTATHETAMREREAREQEAARQQTAKDNEAARKFLEAEAAARQQAWIDDPRHLAAAQGLVRNAADAGLGDGTITLGGAAGERAQAQGRAAIAEAGARIQAGENNQQVIDDLCATLDKIGSVITNMSALRSHLDALDGKLDLVSSQVKSARP